MHPPLDHQAVPDEQLSLTDYDVNILLQIINRAEQQPDAHRLPFRAIFAAYDAVLSENGIEKETDRTYLRFLFQLGGKSVPGEKLSDKFEALLARMGIFLDYGDGRGGGLVEENVAADTQSNYAQGEEEHAQEWWPNGYSYAAQRGRRPRRASFNSMYDAANETTRGSIHRPSSRSSVSRLELGTRASSASPSGRREALRYTAAPAPLDAGGRVTAKKELRNNHRPSQPGSIINKSTQPYVNPELQFSGINKTKTENHIKTNRLSFDSNEGSIDDEPLDSPSENGDLIPKAQLPPELLYQPSLSHLLRDASTFNMYRQRGAVRQIFAQWAESAKRRQEAFKHMQNIAIRHDALTLLRQGFDTWQGVLQQKRQEAQTERFFKHLEKRAARARDLYLLTKAFTHWAQVASDEIERTSKARRHILCIKYFNAWREITAVNEMKAQRLAMMKPFKAWKTKLQLIRRYEVSAVAIYEENLGREVYWKWFWSFCDRRAPQWRDYRLKNKSLLCWLRALRTQRERDHDIDVSNKQVWLQGTFYKWYQRSRDIVSAQQQAESRWKVGQVGTCFSEWRIRSILDPIADRVTNSVNSRILRSAINTWAVQTRMSRQAQKVDRLRIMRNTWTSWNDNLRCVALSARIDERMVLQALYKWVLVARLRLMTRIHAQRVKREMLGRLTINSRGIYTRLLLHEEDFRAHRSRELLRTKIYDWREKLATQRRRDHIAMVFYAPRLEQETLDFWRYQVQHARQLDTWANDARYYFLMTRYVKQWRAATVDSSKKRRQDAYAMVRRKIKVNLATQSLSIWRSKTAAIADLERQAVEVDRNKLFKSATELFDTWRQAMARRGVNVRDSDIYFNRQLAYNYLTRMVGLFTKLRAQDERASQFEVIHASSLAITQLRKLSLRIFQLRTSLETADALNERTLRKHVRNMFRHWHNKTREKLGDREDGYGYLDDRDVLPFPVTTPTPVTDGYTSYSIPPTPALDTNNLWHSTDHSQNLDISDLGPLPSFTPASATTTAVTAARTPVPTPGYLNSPSKRAARARALAQQVSTTPATPVRTPFAARLRAQQQQQHAQVRTEPRQVVPGSAMGSAKVRRRSSLGVNVRFAGVDGFDDSDRDRGVSGEGSGDGDDEGDGGDGIESPTEGRSRNR
ncbi:hypothetical protein AJ79_05701 [Helicocarpus griseus UAMH5409]|uniref:Sfi1 spindle body domain-containing protein n=1 Tax=Helicocarpus griseus UAMH5409 TaxID=1447875 RepID=A0A2B7XKC4_9EURO|nr:hypothetical protein AJ79_05701 [Helicocarpus griseus UAMH5409]